MSDMIKMIFLHFSENKYQIIGNLLGTHRLAVQNYGQLTRWFYSKVCSP